MHGKSDFEDDGTQNYLVFQPVQRYFKKLANSDHISAWKSKELSSESIKPPAASNESLAPALNYINTKLRVKFDGSCLKQDELTFTHKKLVNIDIVNEIDSWPFNVGKDFAPGNSLFGAIKLAKDADFDTYNYSEHGFAFDACGK